MIPDSAHHIGEGLNILLCQRFEQQFIEDSNMARKDLTQRVPAFLGDRDGSAALIVDRRRPGDQPPLLERLGLVGEAAAAIYDTVGEVGHPIAAGRRITQPGEELELHVAEVPGVT